MNNLFSIVFGIPSIICSFGGIVSFIWLIILGEWTLAIGGIFFAWLARTIIGLLNLIPSSIIIFGTKIQKKNTLLSIFLLLIGISVSYLITYIWSYNSARIILHSYHENIIPHVLFTFSFIMAPFIEMKDINSPATTIHILSVLLGSFIMLLFVLVNGYSSYIVDRGAMYMLLVFLLTIIIQTYFTYLMVKKENMKEKQRKENLDNSIYAYEHRWDYLLNDIDYKKLLNVMNVTEKALIDKISANDYEYQNEELKNIKNSLRYLIQFTNAPSSNNAESMLDTDFNNAISSMITKYVR